MIKLIKDITLSFVFLAVLFTLAACTSSGGSLLQTSETHPPTTTDSSKTISFPRQKKTNGEWAAMDALVSGTLILVDNCLRLKLDEIRYQLYAHLAA